MTKVNMKCPTCSYTARRPLCQWMAGARGVHEQLSESALCPSGHGHLVREDGRETVDQYLKKQEERDKAKGL